MRGCAGAGNGRKGPGKGDPYVHVKDGLLDAGFGGSQVHEMVTIRQALNVVWNYISAIAHDDPHAYRAGRFGRPQAVRVRDGRCRERVESE